MTLIFIALGGAVGSVLRYLSTLAATRLLGAAFPFGTLFVNVVGAFAMGIAFHLLIQRGQLPIAPAVTTGLLGGFTTFSAFSLDAILLFEAGRTLAAGAFIVASVALSLIALALGLLLARSL